jgi:transcriptional regulator with XRE-family HTH domain
MTNASVIFLDMITPEQCRAARALLNWTQQRLADTAEVGIVTVRQFEAGKTARPQRSSIAAIERAMAFAGVEFIDDNGVGAKLRMMAAE